ncbi:MAG: hypothetical protein PHD32_10030 [Eubacteriales bacterium]|nr:hypothetical protein [Eubacteriales bacterium]
MATKRRFGDRKDGRRLRTLHPVDTVSPYIMRTRADSQNYIMDKIDLAPVDAYIRAKRAAGLDRFGVLHVILASYVRAVSQKPGINRFISGQKIFARNNIEIVMAVKQELRPGVPNTLIKTILEPTDTAEDVYRKFTAAFEKAYAGSENNFDGTARIINYIPGLFKRWAVGFLNFLDYFGWLPRALTSVSPFHGSFFITSMASLGIPPIYHHLYNFGNVPVFIAFGAPRRENQLADDGSVLHKKYIDYTVVTDERICDGFYFASALRIMRRCFRHPEMMDVPPENVVCDID